MEIVLSAPVILVGLFLAIMHVTVSFAIMQLGMSEYVGDNSYCIFAGGSLCSNYANSTFCNAQLFLL